MKIRVVPKNADKIEAALRTVNGKATSFTLTAYHHIETICLRADRQMEKSGLAKSSRTGCKVCYSPAGPRANGYKYPVKSTYIEATRGTTGWFLTQVETCEVSPKESETLSVRLTGKQAQKIVTKALEKYFFFDPETYAKFHPRP